MTVAERKLKERRPTFAERAGLIWRRLGRMFGSELLLAAAIGLVVLIFAASITHYFLERGRNPDVNNLLSSFQWVVVTVITSSSPFALLTKGSKWLYYIVLLIKPGFIAVITATIASKLLGFLLRQGSGKGVAKVKDHIIICGWSTKANEIIGEIRGITGGEHQPLVVLAPLPTSPTTDEWTTFISGDPTKEEDLRRAGIENAKTAIVLADNSYPDIDAEDMDSRTLLATLTIESMAPDCYTCVEVINSENRQHFDRTNANELVVTARLTGALLAHSAVTHGLTRVVGDLVTKPEGDEFYWVTVPDRLVGSRFSTILQDLKEKHDVMPIAVAGPAGEYDTNPPANQELKAGDRLLVIAKSDPKLM